MAEKRPSTYTFTLKKKELIAVVAGILVTYVMVFVLGYSLGKEAAGPIVPPTAQTSLQEENPITTPSPKTEESLPIAPPKEEKPTQKEVTVHPPASTQITKKTEVPTVKIPVHPIKKVEERKSPLRYFVQAGAFSKEETAHRLFRRLKEKGYPVKIAEVGKLHKVLIGPFTSRDEAVKAKRRLIKDEKIYGYIIKN
jgi:cell division protein FtsN